MAQLLGQAQARGLVSDQEVAPAEFAKIEPERRRAVLAQSTVESIAAYQLQMRRNKRDEGARDQAASPDADEVLGATVPGAAKVEQVIHLQDFPQTTEDLRALVNLGFEKLNAVYIIEEIFNREIEDEADHEPENAPQ